MKRKRNKTKTIDEEESAKRKKNGGKRSKMKSDVDEDWTEKDEGTGCRNRKNICFLHSAKLAKVGDFVSLQSCYEGASKTLEYLHNVRQRRRNEEQNSVHLMKPVCDLIPNSLDGLDLETNGWHRKCYQAFTKNLDRLKKQDTMLKSQET